MYHGVGPVDDDPFNLFVSPGRFRQQMCVLQALGLRGVGLGELDDAQQRGAAEGLVGLTFDDAYRQAVYRDGGLALWRHEADGRRFSIRLTMASRLNAEGDLTLVASAAAGTNVVLSTQ